MEVEYIGTSKLIPYVRNAKLHNETQVAAIAKSIKEFGFNNPVLVDEKNSVIAGHGRIMAAELLVMKLIPCIRLSHLSESQKKGLYPCG